MVMNMFNVSVFSANTLRDIRAGNPARIWNASVLQNFNELENDNLQWTKDARIAFPYQVVPRTSGDHNSDFASEIDLHVYRGFWSEALWNKHRGAVITLNQALLDRLDAAKSACPGEDFENAAMKELRYKATKAIQIMIQGILASVPFSLGDVPAYKFDDTACLFKSTGSASLPKSIGGYFILWSLKAILRCAVASAEQRKLARAALIQIGRKFGINYAVKSAQDYMGTDEDAMRTNSNADSLRDHFNLAVLA
jgi:hypothetical protein